MRECLSGRRLCEDVAGCRPGDVTVFRPAGPLCPCNVVSQISTHDGPVLFGAGICVGHRLLLFRVDQPAALPSTDLVRPERGENDVNEPKNP